MIKIELHVYEIGSGKRVTELADGGVMLTEGPFLAPTAAVKLTPGELEELVRCLSGREHTP